MSIEPKLYQKLFISENEHELNEVVWREMPDALLDKTCDGETLREVIEGFSSNGVLEALPGGRHRWGLKRGNECQLEKLKYEFNFVLDADGNLVDGPKKKPSKARLAALQKRNALIEKVEAQQAQGYALGLLGLDEFFDGNFDAYSLATNIADSSRPPLKRCHKILSDLRARDDVSDVLCEIQECPEAEYESDDELWLICNDVLIITRAPLDVVQRLVAKLKADVVGEPGPEVSAGIALRAGLTLAPGERVVSLWWD